MTLGAAALTACGATPTATPAPKPTAASAPAAPTATKAATTPVQTTPAAQAIPKVYYYYATPGCGLDGSDPQKLDAVKHYIVDAVGVEPVSYLGPPGDAGTEKLNLLLASSSEPLDLFAGDWSQFQEAIIPIDDLLNQYGPNILRMNTKGSWATMKDSAGKTWGYPRLGLMGHTHPTWFRTDWLAEVGLKMPETWDDMENAFAAMKKAHPDAVILTSKLEDMCRCLMGGMTDFGYSNWVDPADNMLKPYVLQPGFKDFITRMNEWWQKNWWQKETFAAVDVRAQLKTLNVGLYAGWYSRIVGWWEQIKKDAKLTKEDYDWAKTFKGPKGLMKTNNAGSTSCYMITKKSKNAAAVMKVVDWQLKGLPEDATNQIIVNIGLEGVDWKWVDKSKNMFQIIGSTECGKMYAMDYCWTEGMQSEPFWLPIDPDGRVNRGMAFEHDYALDYSRGKMPVDYDVPYDKVKIAKSFPGITDFNRLMDEELTKFISNVRPVSDWDNFVKQLSSAGLADWSKAYTEQYRKYHA